MNGINLLPPEFKLAQKRSELNARVIIIGFYLLLGLLSMLSLIELSNRLVVLKFSQNQTQIRQLEDEIQKLQDVEQTAKSLEALLKTIDEIKVNQVPWSKVLNEIAASTPTHLQLTTLTITAGKSPNFSISGFAESVREITKFKEKLEASPYFTNTSFSSAAQSQSGSKISYGFTLTTDLEKKK